MQFPVPRLRHQPARHPGPRGLLEDTYRPHRGGLGGDGHRLVRASRPRPSSCSTWCRLRDTPIVTFINKLDREGREPIELLDEIEVGAGHPVRPRMTWPIGMGRFLRRLSPLHRHHPVLRPQAEKGTSGEIIQGLDNPRLDEGDRRPGRRAADGHRTRPRRLPHLQPRGLPRGQAVPGVLRLGGQQLRRAEPAGRGGRTSPRALRPPGQDPMVSPSSPSSPASCSRSRPTWTRSTATASPSSACAPAASSAAAKLKQVSTGKSLAINNAITFMAQDRNTTDEAWAGDIIGIPNHGTIHLGDTFTEGEGPAVHRHPELRAGALPPRPDQEPAQDESCRRASEQLAQEGATQLFRPTTTNELIPSAPSAPCSSTWWPTAWNSEYGVDVMFESRSYATPAGCAGQRDADLRRWPTNPPPTWPSTATATMFIWRPTGSTCRCRTLPGHQVPGDGRSWRPWLRDRGKHPRVAMPDSDQWQSRSGRGPCAAQDG